MTAVMDRPQLGDPELAEDEPRVSHAIHKKNDWMRGYVLGEPVTALCGVVFVPTRDGERYPKCEPCVELLKLLPPGGTD